MIVLPFLLTILGWTTSSPAQKIEKSVHGGSYNSFLQQVGFCKAQSFDTISRSTSSTPSLFQSGKVLFGVGLSHVQFQRSIISCGRCIQILTIDRFYEFNQEVTEWFYDNHQHGNFTVMVFDECTDAICTSGFLDFDIYNERQPVAYGNPTNLSWSFVPCPIGDQETIEFLLCMGYDSCQASNAEGRTVEELYDQAVQDQWFTLYPRNFRIPITAIHIQGEPLQDSQSWIWISSSYDERLAEPVWLFEWTNQDGSQQSWKLDWTHYVGNISTPGYRGGFIVSTNVQN
jgi:hypothetical protein